ncbi:MAG: cyclophilin-like fold protein [Syntrophorhabdaceae bacterium]|nr:cyclophilin-like fold protein [Syntrophorhabdaceae bacterium]MDD5242673.1 cyclophilin-like fold protein [Syntrophorhabdaceae bacterium]
MATRVKITTGSVTVDAEFFDTECSKMIVERLPIEAVPNEWGDEFYFEVPVKMPLDATATRNVKVGDIGYWPPGNALAIFFGPTPLSRGSDPVPASEVNMVGKISGDAGILRSAKGKGFIRIYEDA